MTLPRGIALGEYYHVYNRGAGKHTLFRDTKDYARFLFLVTYLQSPVQFPHISKVVQTFKSDAGFEVDEQDFSNILRARYIELVAFCVMPNHYHLIVRELVEGGTARYMQRIGDAYSKYAHAKQGKSGHVFQGPYQSRLIDTNTYLTHLSAYIHRNPRDLKGWKGREQEYPWSSYQDYVKENRWGGLLAQEIILDQFEGTTKSNYADFVKSSPAKGFDDPLSK